MSAECASLDAWLEEARKRLFQPWYACYWFFLGQPMGYWEGSNAGYMAWISARHAEFRPMAKYPFSEKYSEEFGEYLKTWVEKRHCECRVIRNNPI